MKHVELSRRSFFRWSLASGGVAAIAVPKLVSAACEATAAIQEGPYWLPDAPISYNTGSGLQLSGVVREADSCAVIANASIDRWHANPYGIYEDAFRCGMISDSQGRYSFTTVMPGVYGGLQRHLHFKFNASGYKELITQVYLENENPAPTAVFDVYLERE